MASGSSQFPRRALVYAALLTALLVVSSWALLQRTTQWAQVDITWAPELSASERVRLADELRVQLIRAAGPGADTWTCALLDRSPAAIDRILSHPAVVSTRYLDRSTRQATEVHESTFGEWLSSRYPDAHVDRLVRPSGIAPLFVACLLLSLGAMEAGRAWLRHRIPPGTSAATGAWRVVLAIALVPVVWGSRIGESPAFELRVAQASCLAALTAFGFGLVPRIAWVIFLGLLTWLRWPSVVDHDLNLPIKTLWLMALVPWGDGWSVDAWWRRRRGVPRPERAPQWYGLAQWLPMLMLGTAYAAAAFAKLDETGLRWITDGAVRYFIVIDGADAPTRFGRVVASHDSLAVGTSAGAVLTEATVIVAAVWPHPIATTLAGAAAGGLHAGFWLFQGVFWPAWWALVPAFLPWTRLTRSQPPATEPAPSARLPRWCTTLIFAIVLHQAIVSFLRIERLPYVSDFPMYADVQWESKTAFANAIERNRQPPPRVWLEPTDGLDPGEFSSQLKTAGGFELVHEVAARAVQSTAELSKVDQVRLAAFRARYQETFHRAPPTVRVVVDSWRFDWSVADFVPSGAGRSLGTFSLAVDGEP